MTLRSLYILSFLFAYREASPWDHLSANIAVVEYQPVEDPALSIDQRIMQNTLRYIGILKASNSTLDMIIFPEATLRNNPETAVEIELDNPCSSENYPQFVKDLSCSAHDSQTYVVVNLVERAKCEKISQSSNCKTFGFHFYNTDVIFDRQGSIIGRYRKYNLFKEDDLDKPNIAERVTFETDFGIKFGIFTCFDVLFKSPAQDLMVEKPDGVIFPSMWYSELPFLTALQTQQMWAYAHDVRFFGAGANEPKVGSGGSGIYEGSKGTGVEGIVAKGGSEIFIYESVNGNVPSPPRQDIDDLGKEMDSFHLYTDSSLPEFNYTLLDKEDSVQEVCHGAEPNRLCCKFTTKIQGEAPNSNKMSYTYLLIAFSGVRSFRGAYHGGVEICAVIACLNSSLSSCGRRFPNYEDIEWPITFERITIQANFVNNESKTQYPNSLLSSIRPIDARDTTWTSKSAEQYVERTFSLRSPQNRLLTFAIYGRDFTRDSPPAEASANPMAITWFLILCTIILLFIARPAVSK